MSILQKIFLNLFVPAFTFFFPALCSAQQANPLANTIWTGNAKVTIPKLNFYADQAPLADFKTVSNLIMIMPVEVWIWDSSTFLLALDMRKLKAGPDQPDLQPLLGEWKSIQYGVGDYFEVRTGTYTYASRTKRGTFKAELRDTVTKDFDVDRITAGLTLRLGGSIRTQGAALKATGTYSSNYNPEGPASSFSYSGGFPKFEVVLTRATGRTPSSAGFTPFRP